MVRRKHFCPKIFILTLMIKAARMWLGRYSGGQRAQGQPRLEDALRPS